MGEGQGLPFIQYNTIHTPLVGLDNATNNINIVTYQE